MKQPLGWGGVRCFAFDGNSSLLTLFFVVWRARMGGGGKRSDIWNCFEYGRLWEQMENWGMFGHCSTLFYVFFWMFFWIWLLYSVGFMKPSLGWWTVGWQVLQVILGRSKIIPVVIDQGNAFLGGQPHVEKHPNKEENQRNTANLYLYDNQAWLAGKSPN